MAGKKNDFEGSALAKAQHDALYALRTEHGVTQAEAAKRIRDHYQQWQRYEQGKRQAPTTWVRKVEKVFGVTLDIRAEPKPTPRELSPAEREGILIAARQMHALAAALFEQAGVAPPEVVSRAERS